MQCHVALGSNLGDRARHLRFGLDALRSAGLIPLAVSSVWETEPVAVAGKRWFWNLAATLQCGESAHQVLDSLLAIERRAGRHRGDFPGPRTLDLDLLLMGDRCVRSAELEVPHPRMWQRRFVLEPLLEIAPDVRNPRTGRTVAEEHALLDDDAVVVRLGSLPAAASRRPRRAASVLVAP